MKLLYLSTYDRKKINLSIKELSIFKMWSSIIPVILFSKYIFITKFCIIYIDLLKE